jgi:alpha-beta hydrolase superfamily lysophospholipase
LGGAIAIHFAAVYGPLLDGLILTAPAYLVGESLPEWKLRIGKLLVPLLPALRMPGGRDKSDLSRDPSIGPAFLSDPLCSRFNTLGQGQAILSALEQVPEKCAQISLPTLIVHGSADRLIRPEGSQKILEALKSKDKTLHYLAGGFHEPHNDLDKEAFFAILDRWIRAHLDVKSLPEKKAQRVRVAGRSTKAKRDRSV